MPKLICFTLSTINVIELHSSSTPKIQLNTVNETSYGLNLNLIWSTAFSLNPNALSSTTSLIPDPNNAAACACTPGFWLFRAAMAMAWPSPTLSSECRRPLGTQTHRPCLWLWQTADCWCSRTPPTKNPPPRTRSRWPAGACGVGQGLLEQSRDVPWRCLERWGRETQPRMLEWREFLEDPKLAVLGKSKNRIKLLKTKEKFCIFLKRQGRTTRKVQEFQKLPITVVQGHAAAHVCGVIN